MERKTDAAAVEPMLTITRTFDAPRELVFRAWTQAEHFARWWGPRMFTTPHCTLEPRVGGTIRYCMRSSEGEAIWQKGIWCKGVFTEIVPPQRLAFTSFFSDEKGNMVPPSQYGLPDNVPEEMLTEVTLVEQDGKTIMTMRQSMPESMARKVGAVEGWNQSFDKLAEELAKAA